MSTIKIGSRLVGDGHPCFVVGEIGINHNGSVEIAKQLIDTAIEAGCDAVKFQKRHVPIVYTEEELANPRQVDPSIIQHALKRNAIEEVKYTVLPEESLKRLNKDPSNTTNGDLKYALEFGLKEYDMIDSYCNEKGIVWFASSWDGLSVHLINGFDVPCHKIASACLTHADLLKRIRSSGKPVILSTGMSTMEQIEKAVELLDRNNLIILHCVSSYPSKDEEANLSMIETLKHTFRGIPIGYSGHETDFLPSILAVTKGACMVERHITLDKKMPGSDQAVSLELNELKLLVDGIRRAEKILGDGVKRVYPSEVPIMSKLRRVRDY